MKKLMLTIFGALLVAACLVSGLPIGGRRPLRGLSVRDVASATVRCSPPDTTHTLTREEIEELVPLLQKMVAYGPDPTYALYSGQMVAFTLDKTDGSTLTVEAYAPFMILDGTGYRTEYQPCEDLNQLANRLIGSPFADPDYALTVGETQLDLSLLPKGPYEENGVLMVPLRAVCEALGFQVEADVDAGTVTVEDSVQKAALQAGSAEVVFEGKLKVIDLSRTVTNSAETVLLGDEFYLPLDFFQEFFLDTAVEGTAISINYQLYELDGDAAPLPEG